jgi:hypothetical protein
MGPGVAGRPNPWLAGPTLQHLMGWLRGDTLQEVVEGNPKLKVDGGQTSWLASQPPLGVLPTYLLGPL